MLQHLYNEYGWEELARRIPVGCFQNQPSMNSSLKFLRKNEWARSKLEREYLQLVRREEDNVVIHALKRGSLETTASAEQLQEAIYWMLRHVPQNRANIDIFFLPLLDLIDVNIWPAHESMPLLNLAIERSTLGLDDYEVGVIRGLLARGADPNDTRYWLPLLHTIDVEGTAYREKRRAPRTDIIDILLAAGADPQQQDGRAYTALSIAQAYGLKAAINKLSSSS